MNKVFFNNAIVRLAEILSETQFPAGIQPFAIRDIHGRIRIAIDGIDQAENQELLRGLTEKLQSIQPFCAEGVPILLRSDLFDADQVFQDPGILDVVIQSEAGEIRLRLLDRLVTGQDWNTIVPQRAANSIPRLAFFSLKGGVGRSTALTILAYRLAEAGKNVLLIDLDLESPGLSGLLLPPGNLADFGVVDWLIEDTVGQGNDVLPRMISRSPISDETQGQIRIAAATGHDDLFYLDKLSRVYADVSKEGKPQRFSQRITALVEALETQEKPDVVLIDSRSGLHDLAALSIVGLASDVFLFATDAAQTWHGYGLLFAHWQMRPAVAKYVREKLRIVNALFPELDPKERAGRFLERSYKLFSETLYDAISPGNEPLIDSFSFDLQDETAPHAPLRIKWSNRFQDFDPLLLSTKLISQSDIDAAFGDFVEGAKAAVHRGQA